MYAELEVHSHNMLAFIQHLKFAREVEQKIAIKNGELKTFLKKWKILQETEQDLQSVTIS